MNMTTEQKDRELLELAARAAGIDVDADIECGIYGEGVRTWNPLTDDGDALRLAVKLHLDICTEENDQHPTDDRQIHHVNVWPFGGGTGCCEELKPKGDHNAATRRAIVRAAAEIGKSIGDKK